MRLNPPQRLALCDAVLELANLVAGALVLGQFLSDRPLSWWPMTLGVMLWLILSTIALWFVKET